MARIRSIKPAFFRHRRLFLAERDSGLPLRVAFAGLWTVADREGRFAWEPDELKLDCLPYDNLDFAEVMGRLEAGGFIQQYQIAGKSYGFIPSWKDHQVINQRESQSVLPSPTVADSAHADTCMPVQLSGEGKGREEEKEKEGEEAGTEQAAPPLFVQIIKDFDDTRAAVYGENERRAFPKADDGPNAKRFIEDGADIDLCHGVFDAILRRRKAQSQSAPDSLKYFERPIADAIAQAKAPMLAGTVPTAQGPRFNVDAFLRGRAAS